MTKFQRPTRAPAVNIILMSQPANQGDDCAVQKVFIFDVGEPTNGIRC